MIFPQDLNVSSVWADATKFFSNVGNTLLRRKKEVKESKDLKLPSDTEMRETCLQVYFDRYSEVLRNGNFSSDLPIASVVEDIQHIFNSLTVSYITYSGGGQKVQEEEVKVRTVYPLKAVSILNCCTAYYSTHTSFLFFFCRLF